MLPPFVDPTHCLPYYLTRKGRAVADRVVSVLAYVCPDITYSPTLYPIAAILLHFMSGKLHSIGNRFAKKKKKFFFVILITGRIFPFIINISVFFFLKRKNATTV